MTTADSLVTGCFVLVSASFYSNSIMSYKNSLSNSCTLIRWPMIISTLLFIGIARYFRNKFNVTWDKDESRVSYHLDTYYVFDEEKTGKVGNPCSHPITTINVPLLVRFFQVLVTCIYTEIITNIPYIKNNMLILFHRGCYYSLRS